MRVLKISSDTNTSINLSSPSYLKKKTGLQQANLPERTTPFWFTKLRAIFIPPRRKHKESIIRNITPDAKNYHPIFSILSVSLIIDETYFKFFLLPFENLVNGLRYTSCGKHPNKVLTRIIIRTRNMVNIWHPTGTLNSNELYVFIRSQLKFNFWDARERKKVKARLSLTDYVPSKFT